MNMVKLPKRKGSRIVVNFFITWLVALFDCLPSNRIRIKVYGLFAPWLILPFKSTVLGINADFDPNCMDFVATALR